MWGEQSWFTHEYSGDEVNTFAHTAVVDANHSFFMTDLARVGHEAHGLVPICLLALCFFVVKKAFRFGALRFFRRWHGEKTNAAVYESTFRKLERKFLENSWYATYYTLAFSAALWIFMTEEWTVFPLTNIWANWPLQPFRPAFLLYYLLELAFYAEALVSHFFETRLDDFWVYVVHHVTTIMLILFSAWARCHRHGLLLLLLHDVSDIFLYAAKTFRYLRLEKLVDVTFVIFAISFFFARLAFFPLVPIRAAIVYGRYGTVGMVWLGRFTVGMTILQVLHVYWFYLIARIAIRQLSGGGVHDVREKDTLPKDHPDAIKSTTESSPQRDPAEITMKKRAVAAAAFTAPASG